MADMILGIFTDRDNAEDAIEELKSDGYDAKDISIVTKDESVAQTVAEDTGASVAEGAASGATTGGVIGAIAGIHAKAISCHSLGQN